MELQKIKPSSTFFGSIARRGIPDVAHIKRVDFSATTSAPLEEHTHPANLLEFIYLERGRQFQTINGISYLMKAGNILTIHPGETHSSGGHPQEKRLCYWLGLVIPRETDRFLGLAPDHAKAMLLALGNIRQRKFDGSPLLSRLLADLVRNLKPTANSDLNNITLLAGIVLVLVETIKCSRKADTTPSSGWLVKIMKFIDNRICERISVDDIAAHVGVSRTHFSIRFRKETGFTPHDYILRRKIDIAKARLAANRQMSMTDLAYELNFSTSQHFSRAFKTYAGICPRRFRKDTHTQDSGTLRAE